MTLAVVRWSSSEIARPSTRPHALASNHSGVTPVATVDQLALSWTTCTPRPRNGAAACTAGIWRWMAVASSSLRLVTVPAPPRTPRAVTLLPITWMTLVPSVSSCSRTRSFAPAPTATIARTAATPMTTPRMVSALRRALVRRPRSALRALVRIMRHHNRSRRVAASERARCTAPARRATLRGPGGTPMISDILRIPVLGASAVAVRLSPLPRRGDFQPDAWPRHPMARAAGGPGEWWELDTSALGLADGTYEYDLCVERPGQAPVVAADPFAEEITR